MAPGNSARLYIMSRTKIFLDFFIEDNYAFKWPKKLNESKVSSSVLINDTLAIPGFQASDLLQSMNAALSSKSESERKHLVSQVKAIYQFEIKNVAGKLQTWTLDLKNTPGQILLGKATTASPADIIMSLQDEDFVKLIKGKLSGQNAFMSGKLKLKGNMMLATKLESLLSTLKPVNAKL